MIKVIKTPFGKTTKNENADLYTIENKNGMQVKVTTFGATLTSICLPDRSGKMVDVLLGYDDAKGYENGPNYFGAIIGRCANRIGGAQAKIGSKVYNLANNQGKHHLHGGNVGFSHRIWKAEEIEGGVKLCLHSDDGEENYPGNLEVKVSYILDEDNRLTIFYEATTDKETICNLTNHAYFNLNGHDSGPVTGQQLQINASAITKTDPESIPTGEFLDVAGTVFDFRKGKKIGDGIDDKCDLIQWAGGFDHNWVLDKNAENKFAVAAKAYSEQTGIELICETTLPGLQVYTANFVSEQDPLGKSGAIYRKRQAFCLETQYFPDAVHHDNFPSISLKPGEKFEEKTAFTFKVKK